MATIELKDRFKTGKFAYVDKVITLNGNYNASEGNELSNINGTIYRKNGYIGTFTAKRDESGEMRTSIDAPSGLISDIVPIVLACTNAIHEELNK